MNECEKDLAVPAEQGGWYLLFLSKHHQNVKKTLKKNVKFVFCVRFESCSWVSCKCLWQALKVPVPNEEVSVCFEHGLRQDRIQVLFDLSTHKNNTNSYVFVGIVTFCNRF